MVRVNLERPYDLEISYIEAAGLSTDEKPTEGVLTGSRFTEVDTGKVFLYDEAGTRWLEVE